MSVGRRRMAGCSSPPDAPRRRAHRRQQLVSALDYIGDHVRQVPGLYGSPTVSRVVAAIRFARSSAITRSANTRCTEYGTARTRPRRTLCSARRRGNCELTEPGETVVKHDVTVASP